MNVRAAIFDVYRTILAAGPPPADAAAGWVALWRDAFGIEPRLGLDAFGAGCERVIVREHAAARSTGIRWPEIYWPDVLLEVVPELASVNDSARDDFMLRQAGLWHTVGLMPGAVETLQGLRTRGVVLGIASNAQPYTLRELDRALAGGGLASDMFAPDLCFWSFAHGFSKPDPHVFRLLSARLRATGISPAETLMVGDRLDNDIEPARAQGWRTWHLDGVSQSGSAGDWTELAQFCRSAGAT
jgi:putative hydrolase of the HAD superfamily